jgi:hypothetical protein
VPAFVNLVVIDELSGDVNKLALGMKKTYFLGIRLTHGGPWPEFAAVIFCWRPKLRA